MTTRPYLTTTQLAQRLNLTRQGVLARVKAGTLTPAHTAEGNGMHLFHAEDGDVADTTTAAAA